MPAEGRASLRKVRIEKWAVPCGILLLAAWIRFSHLEAAHFQIDQAKLIQHAWNLAKSGVFPSHFYALSAGYSNFPLAVHLDALPLLLMDSVYAVIAFHIGMNLLAIGLCWWLAERYWGRNVATLAALILACSPWAILYSRRIWTNSLMPPFVMLWMIACCLAFAERRRRWLILAWASGWWLLQLHAGGVIFLFMTLVWMFVHGRKQDWRYCLAGSAIGILPALPWLYAHAFGPAVLYLERMPYAGGGGIRYHSGPLIEFLTARNLANFFRGGGWERLQEQLSLLQAVEPLWLLAYGGAALWILRVALRGKDRIPERILALWLFAPLLFGFVTNRSYTNVYYLPLLPAPMLAIGIVLAEILKRKRWVAHLMILTLCALCVLNLRSVLVAYEFVRSGLQRGDPQIWADGGGTPLGAQLAMADEVKSWVEAGAVSDVLVLLRPVLLVEHELMAFAFPFHLRQAAHRLLDVSAPHVVYPAEATALLLDENNSALPHAYEGRAEWGATHAPYQLYDLPGGSAPSPHFPLTEQPGYANGLRLLGYDELGCAGHWRLHWTPGLPEGEGDAVHFFVHLLDGEGGALAQRDMRAYDPGHWRAGDHIVTTVDFEQELTGLPIETIRVGLYRFSEGSQTITEGIYALDEQGRPWQYAVDIPFVGECVA